MKSLTTVTCAYVSLHVSLHAPAWYYKCSITYSVFIADVDVLDCYLKEKSRRRGRIGRQTKSTQCHWIRSIIKDCVWHTCTCVHCVLYLDIFDNLSDQLLYKSRVSLFLGCVITHVCDYYTCYCVITTLSRNSTIIMFLHTLFTGMNLSLLLSLRLNSPL